MPELPPSIPLGKGMVVETTEDVRRRGYDFTIAKVVMQRVRGNLPLGFLKRFPYRRGTGKGGE